MSFHQTTFGERTMKIQKELFRKTMIIKQIKNFKKKIEQKMKKILITF